MPSKSTLLRIAAVCASATLLQGCIAMAVGAVAGTAIGVTTTAVGMTAKGAGMVVGAVIPGGGDKDKDKR